MADSGRSTYILHNKVIALGLTQIEGPLETPLDYFIRNHEGRPLVDMVVCRGEAAKLLEVPSESAAIRPNTSHAFWRKDTSGATR
ncbi:MAG: hypothetical protein ACLTTU_10995 [Bilophila wadsworthia]